MFLPALKSITQWMADDSVAMGLAILALAVTIGLFLGAIRVRGVKLGISGVLFSAILFGQIGLTVDAKVLQFLRDFALIIFMYAIGLEVGPGFISSLRAEGLRLNLLSVIVLILGAFMTAAVGGKIAASSAPGLFAGAFTPTAGLAAGQETLRRSLDIGGAGNRRCPFGPGLFHHLSLRRYRPHFRHHHSPPGFPHPVGR